MILEILIFKLSNNGLRFEKYEKAFCYKYNE